MDLKTLTQVAGTSTSFGRLFHTWTTYLCTVSEIQRDIGQKSPIFTYFTYIWNPFWGDRLNWYFAEVFGRRKRVLSYGVVFAALNFAILVHYRIVTDIRGHSLPADKQTDGQTHYRIIYCARITSRDKNFKRSQNTFVSVSEVVRAQWAIVIFVVELNWISLNSYRI